MKRIERIVWNPTGDFIKHLEKQGIKYNIEYEKLYPDRIKKISFIQTDGYKVYRKGEKVGCCGTVQLFREVGKKKWQTA